MYVHPIENFEAKIYFYSYICLIPYDSNYTSSRIKLSYKLL